jgi:reverse gyrase
MEVLDAIYKNRCPRCGGDITSFRLNRGEFCDKCEKELTSFDCVELLNFKPFCEADKKLKEFNEFFKSKTANELSSIQKMWAKRFF